MPYSSFDTAVLCLTEVPRRAPLVLCLVPCQVRAWLDAHPTEVVVLWLSKHGNNCATGNEAYAGVLPATKQSFWAQVRASFRTRHNGDGVKRA